MTEPANDSYSYLDDLNRSEHVNVGTKANLLLLQRLIRARPDSTSEEIANVLAQYSDAVTKELSQPAAAERKTPKVKQKTGT